MTPIHPPALAAQLAVTQQPCETCSGTEWVDGPVDAATAALGGVAASKEFWTVPCPDCPSTYLRHLAVPAGLVRPGEQVLIVAEDDVPIGSYVGGWEVAWANALGGGPVMWPPSSRGDFIRLHPGMVVGSAVVHDVLPIVEGLGGSDDPLPRVCDCRQWDRGVLLMRPFVFPSEDISYAAPFTDFASGQECCILRDAAATTVRDPECWGEGWTKAPSEHGNVLYPCLRCGTEDDGGVGVCEPYRLEGRDG